MSAELSPGMTFTVPYPFIREAVTLADEGGYYEENSWRPGVRFEAVGPEDAEAFADGIGHQELTIISLHKPGRFPTRVFYTRQWLAPTGKRFGKGKLHMKTVGAFRSLIRGYRHPYQVSEQTTEAAA